ncbi:sensor histidine kinase [Tianweitania populi]|nr:ATP-binding protein [Tianweitania populi]
MFIEDQEKVSVSDNGAWADAYLSARLHLSRELHDRVGWDLTAFSYELFAVENDPTDRLKIATLRKRLDTLNGTLRGLACDMRCIQHRGLVEVISNQMQTWSQVTQIPTLVELNTPHVDVGSHCADLITAVIGELLTNVAKHAPSSTHVLVRLHQSAIGTLEITFSDDGNGIDLEKAYDRSGRHLGLHCVRERLAELKGNLQIEPNHPRGARMLIHIPDARW